MDLAQRNELLHFLKNPKRLKNVIKRARNVSREVSYNDVKYNLTDKIVGEIFFFGSRLMEMSHKQSDIDVFISIDGTYWTTLDRTSNEKSLEILKAKLKDDDKWEVNLLILGSTVPVLKALYIPKNLKCDIVLTDGTGVENTKLIHYIFSLQPEALQLYHFIRVYIHFGHVNMKRYTVSLLVMFYLQVNNLLPAIKAVQSGLPVKTIGEWQVQFDKSRSLSSYGMNKMVAFMPHVIAFFEFYKDFEFDKNVIVPYLGFAVPRSSYLKYPLITELGQNLNDYKLDLPMAVTDTIKFNYNCAWCVGKKQFKRFVTFCGEATLLLENEC